MVILQFVVNRGFLQICNLHISSPNSVTQSIRNQLLSCFSDVDEVWGDHETKKRFGVIHVVSKSILLPTDLILQTRD